MSAISNKPRIFITGATGYIGGTFLHIMLELGYLENFTISSLVRRQQDTQSMLDLGIIPILGILANSKLIKQNASESDIVFNTANCDHLVSVKAITQGLIE
ncbi:NmrA family NAD(P)-binding protein [Chryseobacterium sp. JUb7]|uniref:NmrA family NAD(P)-binding protein n=1 Tax=Chryseobacterium sp. JUb7 TaxID=2940599 RepID=UPI00216814A1|nr:NmrA family NAD(P)-binding protein [Chryseobacterium sp. JUb7]MCS3530013.1 N-acetyl-gamma-glutamylphosphate reductase [Chryseobacterium sp. JUb7]